MDVWGLLSNTGLIWNNGKLGLNDLDWRGTNKTINDALEQAFKNTGFDRSGFEITKWEKNIYGKSIPVEWKNGILVQMHHILVGKLEKGKIKK